MQDGAGGHHAERPQERELHESNYQYPRHARKRQADQKTNSHKRTHEGAEQHEEGTNQPHAGSYSGQIRHAAGASLRRRGSVRARDAAIRVAPDDTMAALGR